MKKILITLMVFGVAFFFITCDRNDLYNNAANDSVSLLASVSLLNSWLNNKPPVIPPVIPPAPTSIHLYNVGQYDGGLGGRGGADTLCLPAQPPGTTIVHALLSVSPTDQIIDLVPSIYRSGINVVDGGGAMLISTDWNGLWDGNIDMSLFAALVIPFAGLEWWSGSNSDGTYNTSACDGGSGGWTSNASIDFGMTGNSNLTDTQWIQFSAIYDCSVTKYILCVAY